MEGWHLKTEGQLNNKSKCERMGLFGGLFLLHFLIFLRSNGNKKI
jgi:hypothetical protein